MAGIAFKATLNGWPVGSHVGTFRGFVPAFASAVGALKALTDPDLLERVRVNGDEMLQLLRANLAKNEHCGDVRGVGYMFGVEIVKIESCMSPSRIWQELLFADYLIMES